MGKDGFVLHRKILFKEIILGVCNISSMQEETNLKEYFTMKEWTKYNNYRRTHRKLSYVCGRLAAKYAINMLYTEQDMKEIEIDNGIFHEPYLPLSSKTSSFISIAHSKNVGVALVSRNIPYIGIDIEENNKKYVNNIRISLSDAEKRILCDNQLEIFAWTAKEALSKVLKTGMSTTFRIYEISHVYEEDNVYYAKFRYFPQYKAVSICCNTFWITIVVPKNLEVDFRKEELNFW